MPEILVWRPTATHTELAVSSPAVTETIANTHRTYPRRDGQAEWAWVAWYTGIVNPPKVVTNPNTNRARRSLTLLVRPTPFQLRQTSRKASKMLWWMCSQSDFPSQNKNTTLYTEQVTHRHMYELTDRFSRMPTINDHVICASPLQTKPETKKHQPVKPKFHLVRHATTRHDTLSSSCILADLLCASLVVSNVSKLSWVDL